jgi:hypothetical protein
MTESGVVDHRPLGHEGPFNPLHEILTEICPGVYLGNNNIAMDQEFYKKYNIKAVLNCSKDLPFYKSGIHQLRLSIDDHPENVIEFYRQLDTCTSFIETNRPCFIHCFAGMSRSPSVCVAYLIRYHKYNVTDAIQEILSKRPFAFNYGSMFYYLDALKKYQEIIPLQGLSQNQDQEIHD